MLDDIPTIFPNEELENSNSTKCHIETNEKISDTAEFRATQKAYYQSNYTSVLKSKLFSQVVEQSPYAIALTDKQGVLLYINEAGCKMSGYTPEKLIGNTSVTYMRRLLYNIEADKIQNTIYNKDVWQGTFKSRRKTGEEYWAETKISPLLDSEQNISHFLITKIDVTEKIKRERKLTDTRNKLKSVLSNVPLAVFEIDPKLNIKNWNTAASDIFGYAEKEIINTNANRLFTETDLRKYLKQTAEIIEQRKAKRNTFINIRKDGNTIHCLWFITPTFHTDSNEVSGMVCILQDVTARVLMQKELETKDMRKSTILKNTHEMIVTADGYGYITFANHAFKKHFFYSNAENRSSKIFDFIHPDSLIAFTKLYTQTFAQNQSRSGIIKLLSRENETFTIELKTVLVEDENKLPKVQLFMHDISKEISSREHYMKINQELSTLIETVNAPIFEIDANCRILSWNRAASDLTGFQRNKVLNRNFLKLIANEQCKKNFTNLISATINGKFSKDPEVVIKTLYGHDIKWLISINPAFNSSDSFVSITCVGRDITELDLYAEKLEREVKQRTKELESALMKEKELGEMKTKFISMASHEFRTPLTAINFAAGFLKKYQHKLDSETQVKKLDKIREQIKHITRLLDDVLTTGRADEGKLKFKPEPINFAEFFRSTADDVLERFEYSHRIEYKKTDDEITLNIDKDLGIKIFSNLLSNAIKFSPYKKFVEVSYYTEKDTFIFNIKDYGIGIAKEELPKIFERFHRGSNTEAIQGTGLGLPIVKEAVEMHKGEIKVSSKENEYTDFFVYLPFK